MPVIRRAECRRTETPNAVLTTLASPTQGGASSAVWRVDMPPGAAGPVHVFDTEQVWTFLDGAATVELEGTAVAVGPGDTVVMPAEVTRRVSTGPASGVTALVTAPASTRVYRPAGTAVPDCARLDGGRLLPDWIA